MIRDTHITAKETTTSDKYLRNTFFFNSTLKLHLCGTSYCDVVCGAAVEMFLKWIVFSFDIILLLFGLLFVVLVGLLCWLACYVCWSFIGQCS